jgi:hypothetical protein
MKQTAVDWLRDKLLNPDVRLERDMYDFIYKLIEQAKEMERQQIMTAFTQGDIFGSDYFDGVNITEENYYNQTFKSE